MIVRHAEHIGADIVMYELLPLVNLDADTTYCPVDEMDVPASEAYERRVGRGEMRIHNPLNKEGFRLRYMCTIGVCSVTGSFGCLPYTPPTYRHMRPTRLPSDTAERLSRLSRSSTPVTLTTS